MFVHLLPELFQPAELVGSTVVVIDILRASTTICHALSAGARFVVPCLTVEEALALRGKSSEILLGGERGGVKIDSFDLGNSPESYTRELVNGKTIGFTTTNGTKALHRCAKADRVLIGAFANLSAIVASLEQVNSPIHLICAGTNGVLTAEDVLFAGAVVAAVSEKRADLRLENDSAVLALDFWRQNSQNDNQFRQAMHASQGGRNLTKLGLAADIDRACERDLFDFVPSWDKDENRISLKTV